MVLVLSCAWFLYVDENFFFALEYLVEIYKTANCQSAKEFRKYFVSKFDVL